MKKTITLKKVTLIFVVCGVAMLSANTAKSQANSAFETGTVTITAGYGFPNLAKSVMKVFETGTGFQASGFGPLHFRASYGLSESISFGVSINYVSAGAEYTEQYISGTGTTTYDYEISYTSLSVLGRMDVHFGVTDKLDPYWGVGAGYRSGTWSFETDDPNESLTFSSFIPVGFETTIGLRYFFVESVGAYVEFGIAKSLMQAGVAVKF